jgi:hypothetical protein
MSWFFGDFDDSASVVSQIVESWEGHTHQLKPTSKNMPNVWYLLSRKPWNDAKSLYSPNWHEKENGSIFNKEGYHE